MTTTTKTIETEEQKERESYQNLVNLQAVHSEATARLAELENDLQQQWIGMVDGIRKNYAKLQASIASAEEGIEYLAQVNPQWFEKARTLKTPYGSVGFRRSTKLEVKNEELTIVLLEQLGQDGLPFLIKSKNLNLEALEKLDDTELERIKIRRVVTDSCTVKASKVNMGKAVKEAVKEAGAKKGGAK